MRSGKLQANQIHWVFVIAWLFALIFYFLQYGLRSAPSVMVSDLTTAYGLTALGISSLIGVYYYTYSSFALVAGASLDRYGPKYTIPIGIVTLAAGCALFVAGSLTPATAGRLLQGAGSAVAFPGAVYLAVQGFPAKYLATAIGFTQMAGMFGGSAGQFMVAPIMKGNTLMARILDLRQYSVDRDRAHPFFRDTTKGNRTLARAPHLCLHSIADQVGA